eukprot:TRINITY_DN36933_c0_g1_i1.p1 TRINITY_DN36933_c0_g1~~TRINITY_DN36933_c0_g1_i1.p1  ORF type:complete len:1505 (-),score=316.46 TRINITY_DN36933_c0_g1_i1:357-4871(-)
MASIFKRSHHHPDPADVVSKAAFFHLQLEVDELRDECVDASERVEAARLSARALEDQFHSEKDLAALRQTELSNYEGRTVILETQLTALQSEFMNAEASLAHVRGTASFNDKAEADLIAAKSAAEEAECGRDIFREECGRLRFVLVANESATQEIESGLRFELRSARDAVGALQNTIEEEEARCEECQNSLVIVEEHAQQNLDSAAILAAKSEQDAIRALKVMHANEALLAREQQDAENKKAAAAKAAYQFGELQTIQQLEQRLDKTKEYADEQHSEAASAIEVAASEVRVLNSLRSELAQAALETDSTGQRQKALIDPEVNLATAEVEQLHPEACEAAARVQEALKLSRVELELRQDELREALDHSHAESNAARLIAESLESERCTIRLVRSELSQVEAAEQTIATAYSAEAVKAEERQVAEDGQPIAEFRQRDKKLEEHRAELDMDRRSSDLDALLDRIQCLESLVEEARIGEVALETQLEAKDRACLELHAQVDLLSSEHETLPRDDDPNARFSHQEHDAEARLGALELEFEEERASTQSLSLALAQRLRMSEDALGKLELQMQEEHAAAFPPQQGDSNPQKLRVSIISAEGLKAMKFTGDASRCACDVQHRTVGSQPTRCETKIVADTLNPVWNESHDIFPWYAGEALKFTIYDEGLVGSRKQCHISVSSSDFYPGGFDGELQVTDSVSLRLRIGPVACSASICGEGCRLEARVMELESLLRDKESAMQADVPVQPTASDDSLGVTAPLVATSATAAPKTAGSGAYASWDAFFIGTPCSSPTTHCLGEGPALLTQEAIEELKIHGSFEGWTGRHLSRTTPSGDESHEDAFHRDKRALVDVATGAEQRIEATCLAEKTAEERAVASATFAAIAEERISEAHDRAESAERAACNALDEAADMKAFAAAATLASAEERVVATKMKAEIAERRVAEANAISAATEAAEEKTAAAESLVAKANEQVAAANQRMEQAERQAADSKARTEAEEGRAENSLAFAARAVSTEERLLEAVSMAEEAERRAATAQAKVESADERAAMAEISERRGLLEAEAAVAAAKAAECAVVDMESELARVSERHEGAEATAREAWELNSALRSEAVAAEVALDDAEARLHEIHPESHDTSQSDEDSDESDDDRPPLARRSTARFGRLTLVSSGAELDKDSTATSANESPLRSDALHGHDMLANTLSSRVSFAPPARSLAGSAAHVSATRGRPSMAPWAFAEMGIGNDGELDWSGGSKLRGAAAEEEAINQPEAAETELPIDDQTASLFAELNSEKVTCAAALEEARGLKRVLAEARGEAGPNAVSDISQLRVALAEEAAKCRRFGEHALCAEESRKILLEEMAEDAESADGIPALANVVCRAAEAIATMRLDEPTPPLIAHDSPAAAIRAAAFFATHSFDTSTVRTSEAPSAPTTAAPSPSAAMSVASSFAQGLPSPRTPRSPRRAMLSRQAETPSTPERGRSLSRDRVPARSPRQALFPHQRKLSELPSLPAGLAGR